MKNSIGGLSWVLQSYATMVGGSVKVRAILDAVPTINNEGGLILENEP